MLPKIYQSFDVTYFLTKIKYARLPKKKRIRSPFGCILNAKKITMQCSCLFNSTRRSSTQTSERLSRFYFLSFLRFLFKLIFEFFPPLVNIFDNNPSRNGKC